jgi:hypothetical protein
MFNFVFTVAIVTSFVERRIEADAGINEVPSAAALINVGGIVELRVATACQPE